MRIKLTSAEWEAEGERRFGKERWNWKFKCPICKSIMTGVDYKNAGAPEGAVGFSCIGRYIPKEKSQRALGSKKVIDGKPCDYTGGGLFKLNPIEIIEDGSTWFEFAEGEITNEKK